MPRAGAFEVLQLLRLSIRMLTVKEIRDSQGVLGSA